MESQFFKIALLPYIFLYLTVLSLWAPKRPSIQVWPIFLIISFILGLLTHQINLIALIPIILLPIAVYYSQHNKVKRNLRILAISFVVILIIGLAAHLFPGFNNLKIFDQVYISKDAIPYTMYLNFDKTLIGIFLLGMGHQLITNRKDWVNLFKKIICQTFVIIFVVISLAILLGFVRFQPKIPADLFLWFITNLFFVCTAEEAFFRGFIQKGLSQYMKKITYGNYLAILFTAILFGLAHYPGGIKYIFLATIAGIGYGIIYDRSKRIEGSIITHFSVNLTHFVLFTYPMLANTR